MYIGGCWVKGLGWGGRDFDMQEAFLVSFTPLALPDTRNVNCRGENKSGQISPQKGIFVTEPLSIEQFEGTNVTSISAAKHHSAAVVDGVAWTWGTGKLGELGRGLNNEQCRPQRYRLLVTVLPPELCSVLAEHPSFFEEQRNYCL